jgi:hypothetical protein
VEQVRIDALVLRQRDDAPLGAPAHGARAVQLGRER